LSGLPKSSSWLIAHSPWVIAEEENNVSKGIGERGVLKMSFAFEGLLAYQKSLDFPVAVIDVIDAIDTPRKHYRLIEQ
jgi:hypothetical protein